MTSTTEIYATNCDSRVSMMPTQLSLGLLVLSWRVGRLELSTQRLRVNPPQRLSVYRTLTSTPGAVILSKSDGSYVTEAEAKGLLARYGPLEVVAATSTLNKRNNTPTYGIFVKFAYYLDCRDALRVSRPSFACTFLPLTRSSCSTITPLVSTSTWHLHLSLASASDLMATPSSAALRNLAPPLTRSPSTLATCQNMPPSKTCYNTGVTAVGSSRPTSSRNSMVSQHSTRLLHTTFG